MAKRALIIGCGVAGPVLAMYVKKAGFEPVVYERRTEAASSGGSSFNLAPNGMDVLATLGIADQVKAVGEETKHIAFVNHRGKQLGMNPERTVLLNRGELQRVLVQNAEKSGVELRFGKKLTGIAERGEVVAATFDDGSEAVGDLLIGCDGIRSTVRETVAPEAPQPSYTEIVDTGGLSRLDGLLEPDNVMRMTFGLRGFFGYQALPDGKVFWFQNAHFPDEPDYRALRELPDDVWRDRLLDLHRDDHAPITDIIAASTDMERYLIYEAPTVPVWSKGRVCLVGDAAHAMGPHTGQGASMALEDAITLAKCLRDNDDVPTAYAAYTADRKPRVTEVIAQTRRTGAQKSPGAFGRLVRDLVLPMFLKQQVGRTTALYRHHIDW